MAVRLVCITAILIVAWMSWGILAQVLDSRTRQADSEQQTDLGALWGPQQTQSAPTFTAAEGKRFETLPIDATDISTDLDLEQRRKGLLWHNTYQVDFSGDYSVVAPASARSITLAFPFPSPNAIYDDVRVVVDGRLAAFTTTTAAVTAAIRVRGDQPLTVTVAYRSRGIGKWAYQFGAGIDAIKNFSLAMTTNFDAIDFPSQSLAPTLETKTANGWRLNWRYQDLVSGWGIGMQMPEPLQPGPVAERLSAWAPLSLLFYFFVMMILCTTKRIDLHPMHYFFLAASFFAFHLLFAYTVDRIPLGWAFALCAAVSMFLTITYLRIVVGMRFAAVEAGLAQFFYLVLFSLALFNPGYSGLAITIGCIITLFATMQMTARIDWNQVFSNGGARRSPNASPVASGPQ
ncbi:MAG TPA: inner membrane CreD family protein [Candidatus Eremiobacteraceae bacterium]|nr:inner membrane CreD family protein [Candidatus Eremiobacteraceae bacterium]